MGFILIRVGGGCEWLSWCTSLWLVVVICGQSSSCLSSLVWGHCGWLWHDSGVIVGAHYLGVS